MNRQLHCKSSLISAACLAATLACTATQAGEIEADLQQAMQSGAEVDFIVQFSDQLDLDAFPGQGQGRGVQLAALLWALRGQAESSQAPAVDLLKRKGAKRLIQLWSINALA